LLKNPAAPAASARWRRLSAGKAMMKMIGTTCSRGRKHGLQVQPAHSWHMDVGDQARRVLPAGRSEESFGRGELAGFVA
jgi:hypothetical protein